MTTAHNITSLINDVTQEVERLKKLVALLSLEKHLVKTVNHLDNAFHYSKDNPLVVKEITNIATQLTTIVEIVNDLKSMYRQ